MIGLIPLSFGTLILAILVVRTMRRFRHVAELRSRLTPLTVPSTHLKPSDKFHDQTWPLCQRVAETAQHKLSRGLLPEERRIVWRARTPLVLEIVLKEIESSSSAEEISKLLGSIPSGLDRPDPTDWCIARTAT